MPKYMLKKRQLPATTVQRQWRRKVGYPDKMFKQKKAEERFNSRLQRFREFNMGVNTVLRPPVAGNETYAKSLAEPGRYPIFDDGEPDTYVESPAAVVQSLNMSVEEILAHSNVSEDKAAEIHAELKHFTNMARIAYKSAYRSDLLADEAHRMALSSRRIDITIPSPSGGYQKPVKKRKPAKPKPKEETPLSADTGLPKMVRYQLKASRAVRRAEIAVDKSDEAVMQAQESAIAAQECKESIERLHSMVQDVQLTADALPDQHDDRADALAEDAQEAYAKAYYATQQLYSRPTNANSALDRALWVKRHADETLEDAKHSANEIYDAAESQGERAPTDQELRKELAYEKDYRDTMVDAILRRRNEKGVTAGRQVGHPSSQVSSLTARQFDQVKTKDADRTGIPLTAKMPTIPNPPPFKPTPTTKRGELRPYQEELFDDMVKLDGKAAMVVAPTGAGKTRLTTKYFKDAVGKGKKVAFLVSGDELVKQSYNEFDKAGMRVGKVKADEKDWSKPVTVISHGTVSATPYTTIPKDFKPDILVIDEAHHAGAGGYRSIVSRINAPTLIGLTATPYRGDGKPLDDLFPETVCRVDTPTLIDQGYLVAPTILDVDVYNDKKEPTRINEASNLPELYADAAKFARKQGRQKIVIFVSESVDANPSEVVKETAQRLTAMGMEPSDILGTTNKKKREQAIDRFDRSRKGILINYGALNEGFDAPSTDAIILGRNVGDKGTLAQIIGRGMRKDDDNRKSDVLVLNYSEQSASDIKGQVLSQIHPPDAPEQSCRGIKATPKPGLMGKKRTRRASTPQANGNGNGTRYRFVLQV